MTKDEKEEIRLYNKSIETGQDDPGMTVQAYEHLASIYDRRNLPDSALNCIAAGKEMRTRMLPKHSSEDSSQHKGSCHIMLNARLRPGLPYTKRD